VKNAHLAQELDAWRAQLMLEDLDQEMLAHPETETRARRRNWCRAIKRAHDVMRDVSDRGRDAQHQTHGLIMSAP